jgi:hypothetical protein
MYQDGLLHSLEHIIVGSREGKSRKDFSDELDEHEKTLDKCWKELGRHEREGKNDEPNFAAIDIAYWSGRVEALKRFISSNKRDIPAFFSPYALKPRKRIVGLTNC